MSLDAHVLLPRPRWQLPVMIGLTVIYLALGSCSIMVGLMGFMCFDAGVTREAMTMFILGWLLPLSFFVGLALSWVGYGIKSMLLTGVAFAMPFLVVALICGFLLVA